MKTSRSCGKRRFHLLWCRVDRVWKVVMTKRVETEAFLIIRSTLLVLTTRDLDESLMIWGIYISLEGILTGMKIIGTIPLKHMNIQASPGIKWHSWTGTRLARFTNDWEIKSIFAIFYKSAYVQSSVLRHIMTLRELTPYENQIPGQRPSQSCSLMYEKWYQLWYWLFPKKQHSDDGA